MAGGKQTQIKAKIRHWVASWCGAEGAEGDISPFPAPE